MNPENTYRHYIKFVKLFVCLLLLFNVNVLLAQPGNTQKAVQDSSQIISLNQQFNQAIQQGDYNQAEKYGQQALTLSEKYPYIPGKIKTLWLFGNLYNRTNKISEALTYYLQAESLCQSFNFQRSLIKVYDQLGALYQQQGLHQKSLQYFLQAYSFRQKKNNNSGLENNLRYIAKDYFTLKNYVQADAFYTKLSALYRKKRQKQKEISVLEELALIALLTKNYTQGIKHLLTLLKHHQQQKNVARVSGVYNDLGFLYQRKKDNQTAISYFNLSSELIEKNKLPISEVNQTTLFVNTGVAYTHLRSFNKAKRYFKRALKATQGQDIKQAEIYNYLATSHYLGGNNSQALIELEKAINIAAPKKAWTVLLTSYEILALVHTLEGNKRKAQEFQTKAKDVSSQIATNESQAQQNTAYNLKLMERQETRIKGILAEKRKLKELKDVQEKQRKDLALKDNVLKLQQKELALLKKAKELDQANSQRFLLEKVRQEQALLISQGKLREANLEKAKTLAAFELQRKEAEKKLAQKENQKKLALLEKERKLQEQQIQQQKEKARYATGIIILVVGILGLVLAILFVINRNRHKLKKQKLMIEEKNTEITSQNKELKEQKMMIEEKNSEIISQNEELYQQQEEITSQRDNIEKKNKLLHDQNIHIHQSIKAALTIQEAIIPTVERMNTMLPEHFVLFRPKDIVSGDFYWLEPIDNQIALAAIDCTGHGVQGAFMSLIGYNLLNNIVRQQKIREPQAILAALNTGLEKSLLQKEKGYKNGMDMALITWETNGSQVNLTFAGAKRHIYYFKKGEQTIHKVAPSRFSIGMENPTFQKEHLTLTKGDTLYLSSDGYVDQNDVKRKKLGKRQLEKILCECQNVSLAEQKKILEQALDKHMTGVEQRDDILIIGLRF